jgi:FixJ family two-component response regulator
MTRRKPASDRLGSLAVPLTHAPRVLPSTRAVIASASASRRDALATALSGRVGEIVLAAGVDDAIVLAADSAEITLAILDDSAGGASTIERLRALRPAIVCVLVSETPDVGAAVRAMQCGAADLIPVGVSSAELVDRLDGALARARTLRDQQAAGARRCERLRRLCRTLNSSRRELMGQVASLCGDLNKAYAEMADQLTVGSVASEFNALVRQELDLESLLRTALEFLLPRTGPTNAAVFLPSSSGDFSLGAYVNYDRPRDTAEVLFDHLAATLAPALEHEREVVRLSPEMLVERLGEDDWLDAQEVLGMACRHEGECLAVLVLFRDRRQPFDPALMTLLASLRELLGRQLARVIQTHHRHLPKDKWGLLGDDDLGDDADLAA